MSAKSDEFGVANLEAPGIVITIDGPAGSGKSTIAKMLASKLNYLQLDSGALYRAVALCLLRMNVHPDISSLGQKILDKVNIEMTVRSGDIAITINGIQEKDSLREESVGIAASKFAALPEVRSFLLDLQRRTAQLGNVVAEGRDMGTVVFPEAKLKFFLTASLDERARRRVNQLASSGKSIDNQEILKQIKERDLRDSQRSVAPLVPADDAIIIDTDWMSQNQVLDEIISQLNHK